MRRCWCIVLAVGMMALVSGPAWSQNVVNDLLGGKLIKPKVGQWVWYNLTGKDGKTQYAVRQAVVGEEKVGRDTGYWVEFEVAPQVGFKTIYKVLLTGPASDPKNIHRIIVRDGPDEPKEVPVDPKQLGSSKKDEGTRESLGMENVETGEGLLRAEHLKVAQEERVLDLWVNDDICPTGIVRLSTADGEMILRSHGFGGEYAKSLAEVATAKPGAEVDVSVGSTNSTPEGAESSGGEAVKAPDTETDTDSE